MAERRATNKYIPPDFDPKKHKTVNGYHHSHPLRQRASKLKASSSSNKSNNNGEEQYDERIGSLVIRFELPYDAICTHCSKGLAKGTRFNARKKQVGSYGGSCMDTNNVQEDISTLTFSLQNNIKHEENTESRTRTNEITISTESNNNSSSSFNKNNKNNRSDVASIPIYSFVTKCFECSGRLEIRTNPEQTTYDCVSGLKWRIQALNIKDEEDSSNLDINDTRSEMIMIGQDLENLDAMQRINHEKEDIVKGECAIPQLESIIKLNKRQSHDFELNSKLRASHRTMRKNEKETCKNLELRLGCNFVDTYSLRSLLPEETLEDDIIARKELSTRVKKQHIEGMSSTSIFNDSMPTNNKRILNLKPDNISKMAKEIKKRKLTNPTTQIHISSQTCENSKWTHQRSKLMNHDNNNKLRSTSSSLQVLNQYGNDDED